MASKLKDDELLKKLEEDSNAPDQESLNGRTNSSSEKVVKSKTNSV